LIHNEIFKIKSYLKNKNIFLIEDNAHASGAKINDSMSGSIGDFGCHSFFSSKIITTGEGGMITTNDDKLSKICRSIRSRGLDIDSDIEIFNRLGSNYKMPEYESILGISQLRRLESFVEHRMKIANIYKEELKGLSEKGQIRFQKVGKNIRHPYWKFIIFITRNHPSMKDLGEAMKKSGINIGAPYSPLLHLQPIMKAMTNSREGDLPKSEALSKTHFCLPIHLNISESDARKIASLLITILTND
jgi:Predicted pyridoxal phosphate-dependent enzyme apparently involved in regulation of cell wall biogenesis